MIKRKIKENHHQAAYKKGRCCQEHVLRLSEDVMHGFARQENTLAVFLDVSGAFDKVWVSGLIWKIMKMQLPLPLLGIIKGFLTKRSLKVRVGDSVSPTVLMKAGTPQGAVLSPTLFNIFVDDLVDCFGPESGVCLAQYADDIAIWISDKSAKRAEKKMNEALKKIAEWTCKWRINLAPEKSVCLLFSRRPTQREEPINLMLLGKRITREKAHRFLGVKFDDKLDWKVHISEMIASATPRINALKRLAAKSLWRNPEWILKLHEATVNSIWKYGSVAYATMGANLWDTIIKCHSRALKAYCGVPNFISYNLLCDRIGVKDIKEEMLSFAKKRLNAIVAFSPFGPALVSKRRDNVMGIYKSVTETLMTDGE